MRDPNDQRDIAALLVPDVGQLVETGEKWEPYRLVDGAGVVVEPAAAFFADLQAADRSVSTIGSYGHDLLRWWRFLAAIGVAWDKAVQVDARDFARWMQIADKPSRGRRRSTPGRVNPVTGKPAPGRKFAPSTRAHAETVLRAFYDFHLEVGCGPIINPFPLNRSRRANRANANHNFLDPFRNERQGRYRPKVPKRIPRRIPDEQFNNLFAGLTHHRDRALLAFWVSTAARAEELLTARQGHVDPGQQLVAVVRKGSRAVQQLPVSPDAFVWLRLYQEELWRKGAPRSRSEPLWFTLRRPWRELAYPAARAMFARAQILLGSNWTLHDLRHTAAYRMAQDPAMPLTDIQWILGHAHLSTTQIYTTPTQEDVVASALAHYRRQAERRTVSGPPPSTGYNPDSLQVLFGGRS
ncbi:site-specific recombinase XerD [Nonomuraea thailandensis]|uniref:Site-specific recombinase XerD n=1 Tax=Nonomuraea thailandensis TaxID=1188745 RepID=A0A9X2G972_9ACTN|nr:site-specific integrase [Nonomuraea thailandensis]MCP2353119.1 site-specific recombinase XerD [Nonomuraea thailandensis]